MQLLRKLSLRALEFTDVGGHRKTPVHQHSLTWLETLLPFSHHRADASSLLEIRYIHLTQPDEVHKHPNANKSRLHHSEESCYVTSDSYLICPSVEHLSPFKKPLVRERSPSFLAARVRQTYWKSFHWRAAIKKNISQAILHRIETSLFLESFLGFFLPPIYIQC